MMKLTYVGRLLKSSERSDVFNPRMWNIEDPLHPQFKSTVSHYTLYKLGVLPYNSIVAAQDLILGGK